MPFNKTDYTKPPFIEGLMFDPETEEDIILKVQLELQKVANDMRQDYYTIYVLNNYNSYPERWDKGEWINGDTAEFCWYYIPEVVETPEVPEVQPIDEEKGEEGAK